MAAVPADDPLFKSFHTITGGKDRQTNEARPIELSTLVANGTVDKAAYAALPPAPAGGLTFPSQTQSTTAENVVTQQWASVVG